MDDGSQSRKGVQVEGSWIPKTPCKPVLPKPPVTYTDYQGNQLGQSNGPELHGFSCDASHETRGDAGNAFCDRDNCNWEAALGKKISWGSDCIEAFLRSSFDNLAGQQKKMSCGSLLALAEAAADTSGAIAEAAADTSGATNQWPNSNCDQETKWRTAISFFSKTTSEFTPVSPSKAITTEMNPFTEIQCLSTDERTNHDANEQNGITAAGIDINGLQADKGLEKPATDSSFTAVSTVYKDNHNPEDVGGNAIDLNKTPQQKPRRKKHRPKVITESKPQRSPKSVTVKSAASKEKPTGKRQYVRIKAPNKNSETLPTEATEDFSDSKTQELEKKSCRRALNFDIEGQTTDKGSKNKPVFELNAEQQAQHSVAGNQSKSTMPLSHGIEVAVENTRADISCDLNCSVNQMLKDFVSVPEKQAPSTPVPVQANRRQKRRKTNAQGNYMKGKAGVTAHNVQENNIRIMLPANPQFSPVSENGSNCSTSTTSTKEGPAKGAKRKNSSSDETPDTCSTNLRGIQYNALSAYQTLPSVQFTCVHKKKRSGKGPSSATSITASFTTAAENKKTLQTTFLQKDSREDPSTSKVECWVPTPQHNANGLPGACREESKHAQHKQQTLGYILSQTTKKKSRCATRVHDLASLSRIAEGMMDPTNPVTKNAPVTCDGQQIASKQPPDTMKELVAKTCANMTTRKRIKKKIGVAKAASSSINEEQSHGKISLLKQNQFSAKLLVAPPEAISKHVDSIVKQLKNLDINRNSSDALVLYGREHVNRNNSGALVLYRTDGTVIPFDASFGSIRKQRPRPKVDLDEETSRVWKLLLENINSEGIDGTDEEQAKWWEEQRRVFHDRTKSFIARMRLVQGDRQFSPWKGSIVDSVIGVFLTQNVSDHLSSSAFMSLASHFPLKSKSRYNPCYEERASTEIDKPIVTILDPEDTIKWTTERLNPTICNQSSMILYGIELDEQREAVNSNISPGSSTVIGSFETGHETVNKSTTEIPETSKVCYIDERTVTNDALSSQNSVVSSQNSADSPTAQISERKSDIENNTEVENMTDQSSLNSLNVPLSFMELLQKVDQRNGKLSPDHHSKDDCNKIQNVGNDFQIQKDGSLDCSNSSSGVPMVPSSNHQLHLTSNPEYLKVGCTEMITDTQYSNTTKNKIGNGMKDHSASRAESGGQMTDKNKLTMRVQEASREPGAKNSSCNDLQEDEHLNGQTQSRLAEEHVCRSLTQVHTEMQQNISGETVDILESSRGFDKQGNNLQETTEAYLIEHAYSEIKNLNAARKAKGRRVGKEIRDNVDWDALRKQAEANGRKRERTKNAMDSLDWEAVRCADVNEIANTIRERGMNNRLAERIKDFLNRLVREHGSIDLEWLRDVPPDKAKEYLLSIRGLGLKSVECVRLLTLHHLAFPVDTNVGRIAVRLGWVPLQPLPESLQLHLLELYPVLESIQQYLWPRLCKLDQRTLYELHYQMITFGKVFCTKSKPNCNACPMRGECRHFASAFASARLALPGPEDKSIVVVPANRTTNQNPAVMANPLPLPPPVFQEIKQSGKHQLSEANQQSEEKWGVRNCEPIIEVPLSPEPEHTKVTETDMEDTFFEDPDEIPTIKLNIEQLTQNVQYYMQENMELQESDMSRALVALTAEAASIPMPKLKNVSRLRTEHQVYELPDSHPLLQGLDRREPDDPCSYLLAIWTPGETATSIQPLAAEGRCNSQDGKLCDSNTCFSCNNIRETNSQIVRGTLLIPCRTAMRGSFPLNGTYFQVNEVFADHDSSLNPINVPRSWIWNLQRRTVYFGTSIPTIFKGLTTEGIQQCFWRGYVCLRGFDQKTRAPRPLMARLHFPASRLNKTTKAA